MRWIERIRQLRTQTLKDMKQSAKLQLDASSPEGDGSPSDLLGLASRASLDTSDSRASLLERCLSEIKIFQRQRIRAGVAAYIIDRYDLKEEAGYDTVEDLSRDLFGKSQSTWYELVDEGRIVATLHRRRDEVVARVSEISDTTVDEMPLPDVPAHLKPLHRYSDNEAVIVECWAQRLADPEDDFTMAKMESIVDAVTGNEGEGAGSSEGAPRGDGQAGPAHQVAIEETSGAQPAEEIFQRRRKRYKTFLHDLDESGARAVLSAAAEGSEGEVTPEAVKRARMMHDQFRDAISDESDDPSGDSSTNGDASDEDEGGAESDGDKTSGPGRIERARQRHAPLLDDAAPDGIVEGLLNVAELITGGEATDSAFETAAKNLYDLSHREPPETEEGELPPCLTGENDFSDRDILIALPREMVSAQMAKKAVPVGTPAAQYEVGVPLSCFDGRPPIDEIKDYYKEEGRKITFNKTNVQVDWARYTTNPISGCLHTCEYCYARYVAEKLGRYKQGFHPTFFPGRLLAPAMTPSPGDDIDHVREKNVFVGSMSDVFGKWVPNWMIQLILEEVREHDQFNYLFLTKFPQKLSQFTFPENAWIGATVDREHRAELTERHFRKVDAAVKWLSCEPMKERLEFNDLSIFDCVVIGAQKGYGNDIEEDQPELQWVIDLYQAARESGCRVYFKENLDIFPKELPKT